MPSRITQRIDQVSTGDISGVTAGDGLSGGGTEGTVSLALDVNELTVATAVAADYVVIEDIGDNTSKKALISDITALAGDITEITAGTAIGVASGTGPVPTVSVTVETATLQLAGQVFG